MRLRNYRLRSGRARNSAENWQKSTSTSATTTRSPIADELLIEGECPDGLKEFYCFRGRCFTIRSGKGIPLGVNCECDRGWMGYRCQLMAAPHQPKQSPDETPVFRAGISGFTFGLILLTFLIVLGLDYYRKRRKRTRIQHSSTAGTLGELKRKYAWNSVKNGARLWLTGRNRKAFRADVVCCNSDEDCRLCDHKGTRQENPVPLQSVD